MTTKQANKLINTPTKFHNKFTGETFTATIQRIDRWNVYTTDGGIYDRQDLEVIQA